MIMNLSHVENDLISSGWADRIIEANLFFYPNYYRNCINSGKECIYVYSEEYVVPVVVSRKAIFRYASFPSEPFLYKVRNKESLDDFLSGVCNYIKNNYKVQWFNATQPSALFMAYPLKSKHIPF